MLFNYYTEKEMTKVRVTEKSINKVITKEQACEALHCSIRTLYRYQARFKEDGPPGLLHGLRGRSSNNKKNQPKLQFLTETIKQKRFKGFGPLFLSEKLTELYGFDINRESLRQLMIKQGLWIPKPLSRTIRRQLRERRSTYGMMIQFDGSYHDWLGTGEIGCLLLAIDDATGLIIHMEFAHGESLKDIYEFRFKYMKQHGKPGAIYVDRHASYKVNAPQDQFDEEMKTRFQQGMGKLGIDVIYSKTPEGKGRVERSFLTHQDRLVKELGLMGIKTYEQANQFIIDYYLPKHNRKFSIQATQEGDFHTPLSVLEQQDYPWYFSKEEYRTVKRNGTISYHNNTLQLPKYLVLNQGRLITTQETIDKQLRLYSGSKLLSYKKLT